MKIINHLVVLLIITHASLLKATTKKTIGTQLSSYDCIHQTHKHSSKPGNSGGIISFPAYKYAKVKPGEQCPAFNDEYEIPSNVVATNGIVWGGLAIPDMLTPVQNQCSQGDRLGDEACDSDGVCYIIVNCQAYQISPTDHTCEFGLREGGVFD